MSIYFARKNISCCNTDPRPYWVYLSQSFPSNREWCCSTSQSNSYIRFRHRISRVHLSMVAVKDGNLLLDILDWCCFDLQGATHPYRGWSWRKTTNERTLANDSFRSLIPKFVFFWAADMNPGRRWLSVGSVSSVVCVDQDDHVDCSPRQLWSTETANFILLSVRCEHGVSRVVCEEDATQKSRRRPRTQTDPHPPQKPLSISGTSTIRKIMRPKTNRMRGEVERIPTWSKRERKGKERIKAQFGGHRDGEPLRQSCIISFPEQTNIFPNNKSTQFVHSK